jgi:hypothetical protein
MTFVIQLRPVLFKASAVRTETRTDMAKLPTDILVFVKYKYSQYAYAPPYLSPDIINAVDPDPDLVGSRTFYVRVTCIWDPDQALLAKIPLDVQNLQLLQCFTIL